MDLLNYAKENEFAIPGVNVVSSSSVNACMEAAKKAGGPVTWPIHGIHNEHRGGCCAGNDRIMTSLGPHWNDARQGSLSM